MLKMAAKGFNSGGQKTVLITGVSRGLGRALAVEMDRRGHSVIGCSRSQDKLISLQSELDHSTSSSSSEHNRHLFMTVDVRSNSNVAELAKAVMEKKCVPDIIGYFLVYVLMTLEDEIMRVLVGNLSNTKYQNGALPSVNNAGTINKNNNLWDVPAEEFDAVIDTNVKGIANVLRHFVPLMIEKKHGIIVNLSSGWGRSAAAQVAPYCASKWAVEGLSRAVAKELTGGLAIVALSPGVVHTEMLESCFGTSASVYPTPNQWAPRAATMILNLTAADNGASLTV